jgi:hypothetical protein
MLIIINTIDSKMNDNDTTPKEGGEADTSNANVSTSAMRQLQQYREMMQKKMREKEMQQMDP